MNLSAISNEHTVDLDLLAPGGWVLDVGCRFFDLTKGFLERGCRVLAIDPSRDVSDPGLDGVVFERCALVGDDSAATAVFCDNRDAAHLVLGRRGRTTGVPTYDVPCRTVTSLMRAHSIDVFDAVKLDCEGAEFEILTNWPGPVAKQINCAFHDFIDPVWCSRAYEQLLSNLGRWYSVVRHVADVRHGHAVPCHWDSLFILKDLA